MSLKDTMITLIMMTSLIGMAVFIFNLPVGVDTKTFGALAFGAIAVFGMISIGMVVLDALHSRRKDK